MKTGLNNPARYRGSFGQTYRTRLYLERLIREAGRKRDA